jgi:hypothetical protein
LVLISITIHLQNFLTAYFEDITEESRHVRLELDKLVAAQTDAFHDVISTLTELVEATAMDAEFVK